MSSEPPRPFASVPLFGVPLAVTDYQSVVDEVNRRLREEPGQPMAADAINTMGMAWSCGDARLHDSLVHAYDAVLPDGMPLVWCMNAKGADMRDRVYGPYVTEKILAGLARPTKVALIGGFADMHRKLAAISRERFPNAEYVLMYDAPPAPIDDAYVGDCLEKIRASGAELVFVCLGVPRQYYWVALAKNRLGPRICLSVGGAFDLIIGLVPYAPVWMQKAGLTWLYRLCQEPRRLWKRYFKFNTLFVWHLLTKEILTGKMFSEQKSCLTTKNTKNSKDGI